MVPNASETKRRYLKASRAFRKSIKRDPSKAKATLLKAGILVQAKSAPSGVRLAKRFRAA